MTMATKIINDKTQSVGRTEFQLHISQFQSYFKNKKVLWDFSEHRLRWYIKNIIDDPQKKILINAILVDYINGRVAIAWKNGEPVYVRMNRGV
jgi:hypothetical protein